MSWGKQLGGRLPDFADVVRRFPIAVAVMAAFTLWLSLQLLTDQMLGDEFYIFGGFILFGYVSVIIQLISEANSWSRLKATLLGIWIGFLSFLLCYFAKDINFNVFMAIAAAIAFLGNAAAFRLSCQELDVWNFTQKLWTGALFAAVGSGIFTVGMFAIHEAMKSLFGINIEALAFKILLPIGLAFLAPVYWLGTLPRYGDVDDINEMSFEARALSFLGVWMLAPLVTIYAVIVMAYGTKVLLQWELPKGEIATLVTPFLAVGMLVWLILVPKVLNDNAFVRFYRKAWHWVMLVATVLLAIAVLVRIQAYGFTTERFLLMLVSIWAFTQSTWFLFKSQAKRDIRIPTLTAATLLLLGAFLAQPISMKSQYMRAEQALSDFNALSKSDVASNPKIADPLKETLKYLIRNAGHNHVAKLFPNIELPESSHGPEWSVFLKNVGIPNDNHFRNNYPLILGTQRSVKPSNRKIWRTVGVESASPAFVNSGTLHGPFTLMVNMQSSSLSENNIVIGRQDLNLKLRAAGQVFDVDLTGIIDERKKVLRTNNTQIILSSRKPEVQKIRALVLSSNGVEKGTLITTGGSLKYDTDGELRSILLKAFIAIAD